MHKILLIDIGLLAINLVFITAICLYPHEMVVTERMHNGHHITIGDAKVLYCSLLAIISLIVAYVAHNKW